MIPLFFYMSATDDAVVELFNSTVDDFLVALENASIRLFDTEFFGDTIFDVGARISIDKEIVDYLFI